MNRLYEIRARLEQFFFKPCSLLPITLIRNYNGYNWIFLTEVDEKIVENTNGNFLYSNGYEGKNIDTPLLMSSITKLFTTTCICI
ncbi:hypothetical protein COK19_18885 [Bacillus cereus]|nr:hypothetical protein COK19_18885 [Bacillus cereus]